MRSKKGQPELATRRLLLRSFKFSDAEDVRNLAGNFNVSKTTLNIAHPYELGMAEKWIGSHSKKWSACTDVFYAITLSDTKELIGAISVVGMDGVKGELGYWIGEPHWNRGYCTEAAKALLGFSFESLGLSRIVAEHLSSNPASGRVLRNAGMKYVGRISKPDRYRKMADLELYEIKKVLPNARAG